MKIKKFAIYGLFGKHEKIAGTLHSDLNILTGRNGAGKTTILKVLWYVISGNIFLALKEVPFQRVVIETNAYVCSVIRQGPVTCKVELTINGKKKVYEDLSDSDGDVFENAEDLAGSVLIPQGSSIFFPTFRRIEGGFTISTVRTRPPHIPPGLPMPPGRQVGDLENAFISLSRKLSKEPHSFVSSISTVDIVSMLLRHYTELSETYNIKQQQTSQHVIRRIKDFKSDKEDVNRIDAANEVLDQIRLEIEKVEKQREEIMKPITTLQNTVASLIKHVGIKISSGLSFGDAAGAVNSDVLSAGEKQMLSFVCYNAFYKDSIIFIDEPELSLHVDWQRQLFPILKSQNSTNQFIIATHSPFIYTKYPDKEICIDIDKGNNIGNEG